MIAGPRSNNPILVSYLPIGILREYLSVHTKIMNPVKLFIIPKSSQGEKLGKSLADDNSN